MEEKCFEIGEFSKSYFYILLTSLLFIFKSCVLNLGDLAIQTKSNIFGIETIIQNHVLIKLLLEYLGYILYGAIFLSIFTKKKLFTNIKEVLNDSKNTKNKLIYKKIKLKSNIFRLLLISSCTFGLQLIIRNILSFCNVWMLDLWIFNIIFIWLFMKISLKSVFYKHQIYSLFFNFVINLILILVACGIKDNGGESDFDNINNVYGSYSYIPLFLLVYIILSAFLCYSEVTQKKLMDREYISPYKILFVIGLFSSFFVLLALILTTNIKCSESMSNNNLCPISYQNNEDKATYFDNFFIFINNLGDRYNSDKSSFFVEIFLVYPLYSFSCFMKYFFETMIVYHLNPNYVLISDNIFYSTRKIITLINNPSEIKTYLKLLGEIIALFGYLICLEIFKFKCCGFSYNTRLSINKRGIDEFINVIFNEEEEDDDDEINTESNSTIRNESIMVEMNEKNTIN